MDTVKAKKLAYYGHTIRKQGSWLEKDIMPGTMPGARRRGRPRTAWMDNTKTWTGLLVEESIRMTQDRDTWRKYTHGVANSRIEDGNRNSSSEYQLFSCAHVTCRQSTTAQTHAIFRFVRFDLLFMNITTMYKRSEDGFV